MPDELIEAVDQLVGKRKRSAFIAEAIEEKLARVRLLKLAEAAAGSLNDVNVPGWESRASIADWVRDLRRGGDNALDPAHARGDERT